MLPGYRFEPKYTITNTLLANIKRIGILTGELNNRTFPNTILIELEKSALEVSSFSSTSIEGNPLPLAEVKKVLKNQPENIRNSEREVINYNQALENLNQKITTNEPFTEELILQIHAQVMNGLLPISELGDYRDKPVFVNNPQTGETIYWPPDAFEMKELMGQLVSFINSQRSDMDPLILAGIFHKQFVIIHPFLDGNGPTTRLITKYLLAAMGIDTFRLFSFENYYNKNVSRYFEIVGAKGNFYDIHNDIDFTSWLEYFTEGIVDELLRVKSLLEEKVSQVPTMLQDHHQQILDHIKQHGHINDSIYAQITDRAKATRVLDFNYLIDHHLILRHGKGKSTYYVLA